MLNFNDLLNTQALAPKLRIFRSFFFACLALVFITVASTPPAHAGVTLEVAEADDSCTTLGASTATKFTTLAAAGAAIGAAVGTMIPVVGTLFGAVVGAGFGELSAYIIIEGFAMGTLDADNNITCFTAEDPDKVKFCYDPALGGNRNALATGEETIDCNDSDNVQELGPDDDSVYLHGSWFKAIDEGDQLCIQINGMVGWVSMGCAYKAPPTVTPPDKECYVSAACIWNTDSSDEDALYDNKKTKSFFPISGAIIQCVRETLANIFINPALECENAGNRTNLFPAFQQAMRRAIGAALTLYIIFFGIKVALGSNLPKKSEIFMFILKMVLVAYFALGNGIRDDLYPAFIDSMSSLSSIFMRAGGALSDGSTRGLCDYPSSLYDPGYSYLALWDSLDCRIGYYFGLYNPNALTDAALALFTTPFFFTIIIPLLMAFQIVPVLFSILFGIFFISIAVFVVECFIIALVAMTIVCYLAPLCVPMALFKQTKGMFDAWLKLLFQFTIQPAILFAFLALMLTIFDNIYYSDCRFTTVTDRSFPMYVIDDVRTNYNPDNNYEQYSNCTASFGYLMAKIKADEDGAFTTNDAFFFSFKTFSSEYKDYWQTNGDMMLGMLTLCLFAYLFYYFTQMIGGLAADLTGGVPISQMASSMPFPAGSMWKKAIWSKAMGGIKKLADKATGGGVSKALNNGKEPKK